MKTSQIYLALMWTALLLNIMADDVIRHLILLGIILVLGSLFVHTMKIEVGYGE